MIRQQRDPAWSLVCAIGCLLVLTGRLGYAQDRAAPEPADSVARTRTDWATPQSRVPTPPPLAQGVVPHEELFSTTDDEEPPQRQPRLLAETPGRRIGPSESIARKPDSGSLSDKLTLPEAATPRARDLDPYPVTHPAWSDPEILLERLDGLSSEPTTAEWATETAASVRNLGAAVCEGSGDPDSILGRLEELAAEVPALASGLRAGAAATELRRAGHALSRRVDIWRQIIRVAPPAPALVQRSGPDPGRLLLCLAEVDTITGESAEGKAWREYLLVEAIRAWSARRRSSEERLPRTLARQVLWRLTQIPMNGEQRQFASRGPIATLRAELQRWAAEPVDPAMVLRHLERYEQTGLMSDARLLAADCQDLRLSSADDRRRLSDRLEAHYRNANLRVAVTGGLLKRLMPEREPEYAPVRDSVLGMPVFGRSLTSTKVDLQLVPDPNRLRMALEIVGRVDSLTSSTSGPATFVNRGESIYIARKPLQLDLKGIHLAPADVQVYNNIRLRNLQTDFDGIPLFGALVKEFARSGHERKRPAANREIKHKVALQARQRIDGEADARLGEVSERLHQRVLEPLAALSLEPTMVSAETTPQRLTMRLRLAGEDQLGSHTPRPRAPSNSLASFQVHQTAINNLLQRLELEGQTFALPELARHVATRLNRPEPWETDPQHDDMIITFAKRDAVRVQLEDGRVELILAISKLRKPPRQWKYFRVHVSLRPQIAGRSAELAREGIVQLSGKRLGTGSQIALRSIFAQVFPKNRPIYLTPERMETNPKFADIQFTQLVIDDGWLGVALGPQPKQTARRMLRRR